MPDDLLPWERTDGDPEGTGICQSGGGLRSAAYSMGVLQALQEQRGLLYGPDAADFLAVVSGGSYVGATALLNASRSTPSSPPIGRNSAEAQHVVSHGRYLVEDGRLVAIWRLLWRLMVGLVASIVLFTWSGMMLADIAVIVDLYLPVPVVSGSWGWVGLGGFFGSVALMGMSQRTDHQLQGAVLGLLGVAGLVLLSPTLLARLDQAEWLERPLWWASGGRSSLSFSSSTCWLPCFPTRPQV